MSQLVCPGCQRSFLHGAWSLHIAQTKNQPCRAIYEQQRAYLPGVDIHDDTEETSHLSSHEDQFEGDFFGDDYDNADFPGWDSEDDNDDNDDDDDEVSGSDEMEQETNEALEGIDNEHGRPLSEKEYQACRESLVIHPVVQEFVSGQAAEVVDIYEQSGYQDYAGRIDEVEDNLYAPFVSKIDWEVAEWSKLRGPGSSAASELMGIESVSSPYFNRNLNLILLQLQARLGLSYKNTRELNKIIDNLPARPKFQRSEIRVGDELLEMYHRDIIECIQALYGDPEFVPHLIFKPERHYADADCTIRMHGDMHTGKWWWNTQVWINNTNFIVS